MSRSASQAANKPARLLERRRLRRYVGRELNQPNEFMRSWRRCRRMYAGFKLVFMLPLCSTCEEVDGNYDDELNERRVAT